MPQFSSRFGVGDFVEVKDGDDPNLFGFIIEVKFRNHEPLGVGVAAISIPLYDIRIVNTEKSLVDAEESDIVCRYASEGRRS